MLKLADTAIRQYRRRDGRVAFRLRSYLVIKSGGIGFRLSAYLRNTSGSVTLSSGLRVEFNELAFSEDCIHRGGFMMYDLWASGVTDLDTIRDDVGILRIDYHISFTGHPHEEPEFIECAAPVVSRGCVKDRFSSATITMPALTRRPRNR
jgi:hypothetical protein